MNNSNIYNVNFKGKRDSIVRRFINENVKLSSIG